MCGRSLSLRGLVQERLTAAAEEIFALFERTMAEIEEENERKQRHLDPEVRLHRAEGVQMEPSPVGVQMEPGPVGVQMEPSVKQENPETPQIKEEAEGLRSETSDIIISDVFSLCDAKTDHSAYKPFSFPVHDKTSNIIEHPKTRIKTRSQTVNSSSLLQRQTSRKKSQHKRKKHFHSEEQCGHRESQGEQRGGGGAGAGADISLDPQLHSDTEEHTENSSYSDSDEDWEPRARSSTAQMETEADGDHDNQVQIKDTSTAAHNSGLFSKYKCGAERRATVTEGHVSGTEGGGAERRATVAEGHVSETEGGGAGGGDEHKCTVFQKRFKTKLKLKTHARIHIKERPYTCSFCKTTFTHKGALNDHMTTHAGEIPYSCSVCKKTYSTNGSLNVHMRYHTGDRSYSCSVCKKTFVHKSHLSRHIRTHRDRPERSDTEQEPSAEFSRGTGTRPSTPDQKNLEHLE